MCEDLVDSLGTLGDSVHLKAPFVDTNCMFLRRHCFAPPPRMHIRALPWPPRRMPRRSRFRSPQNPKVLSMHVPCCRCQQSHDAPVFLTAHWTIHIGHQLCMQRNLHPWQAKNHIRNACSPPRLPSGMRGAPPCRPGSAFDTDPPLNPDPSPDSHCWSRSALPEWHRVLRTRVLPHPPAVQPSRTLSAPGTSETSPPRWPCTGTTGARARTRR